MGVFFTFIHPSDRVFMSSLNVKWSKSQLKPTTSSFQWKGIKSPCTIVQKPQNPTEWKIWLKQPLPEDAVGSWNHGEDRVESEFESWKPELSFHRRNKGRLSRYRTFPGVESNISAREGYSTAQQLQRRSNFNNNTRNSTTPPITWITLPYLYIRYIGTVRNELPTRLIQPNERTDTS